MNFPKKEYEKRMTELVLELDTAAEDEIKRKQRKVKKMKNIISKLKNSN